MSTSKLKLVCKNDNPVEVRKRDNVLDKDELIAIDRAESIDFSNIENNNNFIKVDIDSILESLDEEDEELFISVGKQFDLRKKVHEKIKNDILTFKPYAMLFDMAGSNIDSKFIEDVEFILNDSSLSVKEIAEEVLDILYDYI